jgi:hypothetical protein
MPKFWSFLKKYCKQHIPDQSTFRKHYLLIYYEETLENTGGNIGDSFIWVFVDETTDSVGRFTANLVAGKLDIKVPSNPHLICSKVLHHANHSTIARFVYDGHKSVVAYQSSQGEGPNFVFRYCGIYAESFNCVESVLP